MLTGLLIGLAFGFVLQRSRFCMTGGFRDIYLTRNNTMFYAFLIAISVQSVGVFSLISLGLLEYNAGTFPIAGTIVGSFIFGLGIVLAGGCATGTWYRAAEGLIGSWIALATYMLSSAMMKYGVLSPFYNEIYGATRLNNSIPESLNLSPWVLVALLVAITSYLAYKTLSKPKIEIPSLPKQRSGLNYLLFEKRWHPFFAALIIGIIAFLAWPASYATGRESGLGITTPSANLITFLVTGDSSKIDWGVFLILGIFLGSYIAAKGSNEFKWRLPDARIVILSFIGGLLMGVGASLAGGCTIGNGLTNTAVMGWKGWISLTFTIFGVWTASYFIYVRARQKSSRSSLIVAQEV